MIDFNTVSREFRSLVSRRRDLVTFLGTVFAAAGIVLGNVLQGQLPPSLRANIEGHVFAFYALMVMIPCLIVALRMAKLHGGMVINGVLYARLMQEQTFTAPGNPERAARHNPWGVSFLQFILLDVIAGFSAAILALALRPQLQGAVPEGWRDAAGHPLLAVGSGVAVALIWMALYFRFHRQAVRFAMQKIKTDACAPFSRDDWEEHVSACLEQSNHGMLAEIGFTGLMVFSVFQTLTSLGEVKAANSDLALADIKERGPLVYAALLLVVCLIELVIYIRVRIAIGHFSLQLDPSDRPFRPLRLTDSLLGYLLLAFLFTVSVHVLAILVAPGLDQTPELLYGLDAAAFALAVLAEQVTLAVAGRRK